MFQVTRDTFMLRDKKERTALLNMDNNNGYKNYFLDTVIFGKIIHTFYNNYERSKFQTRKDVIQYKLVEVLSFLDVFDLKLRI